MYPEIIEEVQKARNEDNCLHESELRDVVLSKIKKTQNMRNVCNMHQSINQKTLRRLEKLCNLKFRKSQPMTNAHKRELGDCRNAVTYAVGIVSATDKLGDDDVFSFDSSSFEVARNGSMHEELVLVVNDIVEKKCDRSISSHSSNDLAYSIKGHFASSKAGHVAPLVIILADDTLEKDIFKVHEARGLSVTGSPRDVGYIVFSKTRSGTVEMWKWWLLVVFIPFIVQCRELQAHPERHESFFFADGEDYMLEALTSEDILQAFELNRIEGGKINASFSPIGAAWDKSKALFQGTKAKIKKLTRQDLRNDGLKSILEPIIKSSGLSSRHKKHAVEGITKLQAAAVDKMNPHHIRHSYEILGQRVVRADGTVGPDFETILTLSIKKNTITNEQLTNIVTHYPQLKAFHDEHAMLTDSYMASLGITDYTTNTPYNRDNRSLGHSRFVMFTKDAAKMKFRLGLAQKNMIREHEHMLKEDKWAHKLLQLKRQICKRHFSTWKKIVKEDKALKKKEEADEKRELKKKIKETKQSAKSIPMTTNERKRKSRTITFKLWKCLNPLCMKEWSEELVDADKWMQCEHCEEMFCTNDDCLGMVDQHELVCNSQQAVVCKKQKKK